MCHWQFQYGISELRYEGIINRNKMSKSVKIIIILVIAGLVIGVLIYFYNKNRKAAAAAKASDTSSSTDNGDSGNSTTFTPVTTYTPVSTPVKAANVGIVGVSAPPPDAAKPKMSTN